MFDVGFAEFVLIGVVSLLVFGPDRLPEFARQAGRMVRQVRTLAHQARDDIRSELGPEYADFELADLDPRRALRKHIEESWKDDDLKPARNPMREHQPLAEGEAPPYDSDAT